MNGVDVSHSGLAYTITLHSGATFTDTSNVVHDITQLFGFWALDSNTSNSLNATGADQNGWTWNEKNSGGDIAGWTHNENGGRLLPGQSITLTYTALSTANVTGWGYHLQFDGGSKTDFITPVPEPASLSGLAVLALGLVRRRKRG